MRQAPASQVCVNGFIGLLWTSLEELILIKVIVKQIFTITLT
ncbi:hypothetical protein SLEP1_g33354 [Rubroshorea leprosula]|uniref:Uncharacterized protein n=1 Tax=Rubroshorea leprosula TaxID=152421 RepID=A0AAV5KGC6_9ROSI|nr:hypothetical protein SLEP1_g33354 [Rubroshorea leprosula]